MTLICAFVAACNTIPKPPPAPIQIPRDCEELAQEVSGPTWVKGANAKGLLADTTVKLEEANGNLAATRACQQQQRETLANPSRVTDKQ